ncbi:unnamed protein product [Linum tenue]|uniref:Uncharacterized protein n=1 Tax=Linum tenue TaxID=586396 RepID=A0AAV0N0Z3_9ROSI|nr:unnamed protein product [Linum tenue]
METADYKLLLTCPSGLSPSQVLFPFILLDIWEDRIQSNSSLYNGKKFRYGGCSLQDGGEARGVSQACLHLGSTDYRTFVGTNLNPLWENFLAPSEGICRHQFFFITEVNCFF